ncbi:ferric-chelate reductase 1-like [Antedon mediterranea]|uniref:ferric-chelate reductase 1-like n=1 Tax=Antedon mediterranea TaxID=105859 RepID=UPI003AF7E3A1
MIVTMNRLFSLCVLVSLCLIVHSQEDPCGTTHGCFRDPQGCFPSSECTYYVSWTNNTADTSLVDFEVSVAVGSGDMYAAMGLSQNDQMPESDIYMCRSDQTMVGYYPSSKGITSADERELKGISNMVVDSIVDGDLHCTFSRMIDLTETDPEFFSLNDDLYVLVAFGALTGGTTPDYHTGAGRWLTAEPVDLLDVGLKPSDEDPCDKTHGCYRNPENCYPPSECTYYVSWTGNTADASLVDFEVSVDVGSGDMYAAMGLSQNDQMPESDIYMCRSDQTMVGYYPSSKSISSADERELKGISNEVVDPIVDGDLHCTFSRMIELDEDDPEFFSMNDDLYVLVAFGELSGGTTPDYHGAGRFLTSEPVDLLDTSSAQTDLKLPRAKKAHACLMVIGWMGLASTGILFARYMKPFMSDQTLCGNKVWFNSHRINMISALVCFVSAFIVIFAVKKEFVDSEIREIYAHGIIGCIAVGLGVINPIMAIFRPHPGTPNRPFFNYAHRTVGILGWMSAMIAIILASDFYFTAESITDVNAFWTITVFLIIGLVIIILFEVFECTVAQQDSAPSADIALRQPGDQVSNITVPPTAHPAERWRSMIFSLALLDILVCTIVMVVFIIQVEI